MSGIARMNKRVKFQRLDSTTDDYGNTTSGDFDDLFSGSTFPCELRETLGRETVRAGAVESPQTAVIKVRSNSQTRSVQEADRAVIDSVNWNIRSVTNPDQRDRFLEFLAERNAGQ